MKRFSVDLIDYSFDAKHSGAHYLVDGRYCNGGEFIERCVKSYFGEKACKDSVPYWAGSDIEKTCASLKSFGASLATGMQATEKDEIIAEYFSRVHSKRFYFGTIVGEQIIVYDMDKEEFNEMLLTFWKTTCGRLRLKVCDTKVIKWCEEKMAQAIFFSL